MTKKIFIVIALSFLVLIGVFFYKTQVTKGADFTGYYISHELGRDNVLGFEYFQPNNVTLPSGTSITYQFASKTDNYAAWTNAESTNSKIDLTKFDSIKNSNYIKVRINFSSNSTEKPSLQGYTLLMRVPDGTAEIISSIKPAEGQTDPIPLAKGVTEIKQNITKTTLSQLIATGGALWFNILIALMIGAVIAFLIIKYSKQIMAMRTKIITIIIIAALLLVSATFIWLVKSKKIGIFASENYQTSVMIISGQMTWDLGEFHNIAVNPIDYSIFLNTDSGLPPIVESPIISVTPVISATTTPTETPIATPSETPENNPTTTPTETIAPTETPTNTPASENTTPAPTQTPTQTYIPIESPTITQTEAPTNTPLDTPTPTTTPSLEPTITPNPNGPALELTSNASSECPKSEPQTKTTNTEPSCEVDWGNSIEENILLPPENGGIIFNLLARVTLKNAKWQTIRKAELFDGDYHQTTSIESLQTVYPKCGNFTMFKFKTDKYGQGNHFLKLQTITDVNGQETILTCQPNKTFSIRYPDFYLNLSKNTINESDSLEIQTNLTARVNYLINNQTTNLLQYDSLWKRVLGPFSFSQGNYAIKLMGSLNGNSIETNETNLIVNPDAQQPNCNTDNTQCSFGRANVSFNNFKTYTQYYAKMLNYYAPIVYQELHGNTIDSDSAYNAINLQENSGQCNAGVTACVASITHGESRMYFTNNAFYWNELAPNFQPAYSNYFGGNLVTHELAHYLHHNNNLMNVLWLEEGMADYVRFKLDYQNLIPQDIGAYCDNKTYLDGYQCAADFIKFVENRYNRQIIKPYITLKEQETPFPGYANSASFIASLFPKDMDTLWEEYKQAHQ